MLIETLIEKISNSMQQLGKIFDQIYKLPMKLREKYFTEIQKLKDKLILLKMNAKQANIQSTDKQYKHIYLSIHKLKEELNDHVHILQLKQNRDPNRPNLKQTRKNHEEAMRLIVEKDQQMEELNRELHQKEELVKVTFEQLKKYKDECELLSEECKLGKSQFLRLEIQYSSLKSVFISIEEQSLDLQLKDQERERNLRQFFVQMQKMKQQLIQANKKIEYYQELAQGSISKIKLLQNDIKILEIDTNHLTENYRRKEGEIINKNRKIQDLERVINEKISQNLQHQLKIDQIAHKNEVLQFQLRRLSGLLDEQRARQSEKRNNQQMQNQQLYQQLQKQRRYTQNINISLTQSQHSIQKLEKLSEQKDKQLVKLQLQLEQTKQKVDQYLMMTLQLETAKQLYSNQLNILSQQKQKYDEQLLKSINLTRQLEIDIKNYKEKAKNKEQQKVKIEIELEKCQREIRGHWRDRKNQENSIQSLENDMIVLRTQLIKKEQSLKQREWEIGSLRQRLMRAKIQILHEIREQIL